MAAGAAPQLVALLRSDQPVVQAQLRLQAAGALWALTYGSQQNRDASIAAGAVPLLIALLRSDQPDVQIASASAVISLVVES